MAYERFLISVLTDIVRVLHERHFDYALAGGLAYSALVEPRATTDIDLLIVVEASPPSAVFQAMRLAFDTFIEHTTPMAFKNVRVWRGVGVRQNREIMVDFLLAESDFHRSALARKRVVDWFGLPLPIVTPEDLLLLKALAGRARDHADIEGIKQAYGARLDRQYLTAWTERLGLTLEL